MKNKKSLYIQLAASAMLLAGIILIVFTGLKKEETELVGEETVSLWYADTDLMTARIDDLVAEYNLGQGSEDGITVSMRSFESEKKLFEALTESPVKDLPELVICDTDIAAALNAKGRVSDLSKYFSHRFVSSFSNASKDASTCDDVLVAIPLGSTAGVLVSNNKLSRAGLPKDVESLCEAAKDYYAENEKSYFTMSDYALFFRSCVTQSGGEFDALSPYDTDSEECKHVFNLLAEAAFDRGFIAADDNPVKLVTSGEVVCALASTADVVKELKDSITKSGAVSVSEYPCMADGDDVFAMNTVGITILKCDGNKTAASVMFVEWLAESDIIARLTANTGYIPSVGKMVCDGDIGRSLVSIVNRYEKKRTDISRCADAKLGEGSAAFNGILSSIMKSLN